MIEADADTRPLHIVLLSSSDPLDVHSFSGTIYYLAKSLREQIPDLEIIRSSRPIWFGRFQSVILKLTKGRSDPYYWDSLNRRSARRLLKNWKDKRVAVVAVVNSALAAELCKDVPVINVSDATFDLVKSKYDFLRALGKHAASNAEDDESRTIRRSVHSSFSSQWAANSAIQHYGADPDKVSVISWGCNLESVPPTEVRKHKLDRSELRLLFVGGEWLRKGGDVVVAASDILMANGIPLRVDLVGVLPPEDVASRPWINAHGYLSKADSRDMDLFRSLMRDSDLLFLPTRSDCTPMVFAEANAYGTPGLTRAVGGVPDVVHDGANGIVLPEDAEPRDFAAVVQSLWNDPIRYAGLRASSRREYETRLNWGAWAKGLANKIEALAAAGRL